MRLVKPHARPPVDIPDAFANASVQLLGTVEQGKHYALAHIDQLGVIERLRFVDVARQAARWAHLLRVRDFQPGDRVLVLADRDRDWRAALLGVLEAGGIAVPCPGSTPEAELAATAADASSAIVLSPRPRPDLGSLRALVFSADDLDDRDAGAAALEMPHTVLPDDPALILYAREASGVNGAVYTHASLLAQASAGDRWLGVSEGERVWCTAPEGSDASIWLLFAAWHARAEILVVEDALEPVAELELVNKLRPAAVWLSADEYCALAAIDVPQWIDAGSIRRALVTGEAGATTVRQIFGVRVEPIFMSNATGVVSAEPVTAPPRAPSVAPPAAEANALRDAEREADERRREEERLSRALAEQARRSAERETKERQNQEARDRTERERQHAAEARRRGEEEKQRERAKKEARRKAEQATKEREKQEARQRAEQQRRQAEQERARERERQRTDKEARRQAKQQAKERAQEEERLRREQQKMHAAAERAAAEESVRAEEARLEEIGAARDEEERLRLEHERRAVDAERRREEQRRRTPVERAENERLAPDIIASISQYGVTASAPVANRDGSGESPLSAGTDERREAE